MTWPDVFVVLVGLLAAIEAVRMLWWLIAVIPVGLSDISHLWRKRRQGR